MIFIFALGQEEINGQSCPAIVHRFEEQRIRPSMVLDEGGAGNVRKYSNSKMAQKLQLMERQRKAV